MHECTNKNESANGGHSDDTQTWITALTQAQSKNNDLAMISNSCGCVQSIQILERSALL